MKKYYVYIYYDPRKSPPEPIYVGRGNGRRAYKHLTKCSNSILKAKIEHIRQINLEPIVEKIHSELTFEEASTYERKYILEYGRINIDTGTLCNFTDRGDGTCGYRHKPETLEILSKQRKGKKQTPAQYAANCNRAPKSELTRLKHSLTNRGRKISEAHKKILRKANLGRVMSEESRKKMSDARKGVRTEIQTALDYKKIRKLQEMRVQKEIELRGNMNDEEWIVFKKQTYSRSGFYVWHKNFLKNK